MNFIEELKWRGLIHTTTPGIEAHSNDNRTGYCGFDPTAPSLQIGNLVAIMLLVHFQNCGHNPVALIGGATAMIGDPSGKSAERPMLSEEEILANVSKIENQLKHFLKMSGSNPARIVNNIDWFSGMTFIEFMRDVGKLLTVNQMIAKDSVQTRMANGISFTEFSYQLLQGWDFHHLNKTIDCTIQMAGSDQWGNMTAGMDIIRKMSDSSVHAVTCPLLTNSEGIKFGKSVDGNRIWLDPTMTSPFKFYQFWLNSTDEDAIRYIKIFTTLSQENINNMIEEHNKAPHRRIIQNALAEDITVRVHSRDVCDVAIGVSNILFGSIGIETVRLITEDQLKCLRDCVPCYSISIDQIKSIIDVVAPCCESRGDAKRIISKDGILVNQRRVTMDTIITEYDFIIQGKSLLVRKGKKSFSIIDLI